MLWPIFANVINSANRDNDVTIFTNSLSVMGKGSRCALWCCCKIYWEIYWET